MHEADDIVFAIREHYTERLVSEFARLRVEHPDGIFTEAALRDADGRIVVEGPSQLGCRVDIVVPSRGQFITVDSTSVPKFGPIPLRRSNAQISLCPFQWDRCVVTLHCSTEAIRWDAIVDWFHEWFDADDTNSTVESGLCRVVHFLSEPILTDNTISFTTDLGSAPVEAFDSLLDACAASRPSLIYIANIREAGSK